MNRFTLMRPITALAVLSCADAKAQSSNEPSLVGFIASYDACSSDNEPGSNTCTGPWIFDYQDNCEMEKPQCGQKPCQQYDWVIKRDQTLSPQTVSSGEYTQMHVGYGKSRYKYNAWEYAWNDALPKMPDFIATCISNARSQIPQNTEGQIYEEVKGSLRLFDVDGNVYNVGSGETYYYVSFTWYDHHHQDKPVWPDVHKIWMHATCTAEVKYVEIPQRYECVLPGQGYQSCKARWPECETLRDASYPGMTYSEATDVGANNMPSADGGVNGIFNQSCSTCNLWPMSAQHRLECLADERAKVDEITGKHSVQLVEASAAIARATQLVIEQTGLQSGQQSYNLEPSAPCGYYYDEHNVRIPGCIYQQLLTKDEREMLRICVRLTNEHVSSELVEAYIDTCMNTLLALDKAAQSATSSCADEDALSAVGELVTATNEALLGKLADSDF